MRLKLKTKREVKKIHSEPITSETIAYIRQIREYVDAVKIRTLLVSAEMTDKEIKNVIEYSSKEEVFANKVVSIERHYHKKTRVQYSAPDNSRRLQAIRCLFRLKGYL
jgi:hypothetical protein